MDRLDGIVDGAKSLVFVNIHGLKVAEATELRREFKKKGVGFFVAKKSLTARILGKKTYAGQMPALAGEFGLVYGDDPVVPAGSVRGFQTKFKDRIAIVGGVFENKYQNKEEMTAIALIPPLETLRGMFVNVINSPIQGLVMVLDQIAKAR